jgi:hypothetical protein
MKLIEKIQFKMSQYGYEYKKKNILSNDLMRKLDEMDQFLQNEWAQPKQTGKKKVSRKKRSL